MPLRRDATRAFNLLPSNTCFVCPTCAFAKQLAGAAALSVQPYGKFSLSRPSNLRLSSTRRYASSLASATAINPSKNIPPRFTSLYDSLSKLRKDAAAFVNISRLQLAIRSLESERPTIRLAILGLPSQRTAKRLARLLLADPLGDKEVWEEKLDKSGDRNEHNDKAVLLRYGDDSDKGLTGHGSSSPILHVPSRILKRHNLEVLVSSLDVSAEVIADAASTSHLRRAALVPVADGALSFAGGTSFLTYPVHRALIVTEGLQGCLTLGKYTTPQLNAQESPDVAMKLASNFPALATQVNNEINMDQPQVSIIDATKATAGIDALRESTSNASKYEQNWNASGLPQLEKWLSLGLIGQGETVSLNPAVKSLIIDILDEASGTIHAAEAEAQALQDSRASSISDATRQSFNEALNVWAKGAHIELRDKLATAFSSGSWLRLSWWKLPWRVDDVEMILSELIQNRWLVDAEKAIIWLSGRSTEAGIFNGADTSTLQVPDESENSYNPAKVPWPTLIQNARAKIEAETIPPLQIHAQALLLQTLSMTTLTTALSALLYVSFFPTVTLYSAGAVGALGLAYSLRRLQRTWETARRSWEVEVRERGRVVLKDVEESFRQRVSGLARNDQRQDTDIGTMDRLSAREAVEVVRVALDELDAQTSKETQASRRS